MDITLDREDKQTVILWWYAG